MKLKPLALVFLLEKEKTAGKKSLKYTFIFIKDKIFLYIQQKKTSIEVFFAV